MSTSQRGGGLQQPGPFYDPDRPLTEAEVDEVYEQQQAALLAARDRLGSQPLQDMSDESLSPPEWRTN